MNGNSVSKDQWIIVEPIDNCNSRSNGSVYRKKPGRHLIPPQLMAGSGAAIDNQSFAATMDSMQKTNQALMAEIIKAFTEKGSSQKKKHLGNSRILFQ